MYSARLTSWLDRLAHFNVNIKHFAGKHINLTDYLSRNLISKLVLIENYDEEYVFNFVISSLEFINTHCSITNEKRMAMQTDKAEAQATNNQSQTRSVNELSRNKQNKRWPLQITRSTPNNRIEQSNCRKQNGH